jgi:hypothetical protein
MNDHFLRIVSLERQLATGNVEQLDFEVGVNLLVGRPNTGKTKWLQTLDFLLGDQGEHPFVGAEDTGLPDKYDSAAVTVDISNERYRVERRWREAGAKSKVFVNGEGMPARDFQHWLLERLGIPILHFPKGNPMSGQTWPELSFRMLLRHIHRQQRFWSSLVDQQPDAEQLACVLQFLGLAEVVFSEKYGELIRRLMEIAGLRARKEQFTSVLNDLATDVLAEPEVTVSVTPASIKFALERIRGETELLRQRRTQTLSDARPVPPRPRH